MSNLVRAQHPNGAEFSCTEVHAKRNGLKITGKPAVDRFGAPLPAKPRTDKAGQFAPAPAPSASATKEATK